MSKFSHRAGSGGSGAANPLRSSLSGHSSLTASLPDLPLSPMPVISRVTTDSSIRNWSEIAKSSSEAVVKILAQVIMFDFLQPYQKGEEGEGIGSGFFIDGGYIVTNAHVVEGARKIWITLPREGERRYTAGVVGVCFDLDLALLRPLEKVHITKTLKFGNSDSVSFGEEVMTLGYPLGMDSLKLTVGIISGRQDSLFQTDAPLNPGNSGGPMMNKQGEVIGINVAIIEKSQNVGFAIPCRQFKMIAEELRTRPSHHRILHRPILGIDYCNCSNVMLEFLGWKVAALEQSAPGSAEADATPNADATPHTPQTPMSEAGEGEGAEGEEDEDAALLDTDESGEPLECEGVYITRAYKGLPLYQAGVRDGDVLHWFNGYKLDNFGYAKVEWSDARVTLPDLMSVVTYHSKPEIVYSRGGVTSTATVDFSDPNNPKMPLLPQIRPRYPPYETLDYELLAGICVMELSVNHVIDFVERLQTGVEQLQPFTATMERQLEPRIVITGIMIGSIASRLDVLEASMLLDEVNGQKVSSLASYREAMLKPVKRDERYYLTFKASTNELLVLPLLDVLDEENELAEMHMYRQSHLLRALVTFAPELSKAKKKKLLQRLRPQIKHTDKDGEEDNEDEDDAAASGAAAATAQ